MPCPCALTSTTTKRSARHSAGTSYQRSSTGCRAAASTSPTRPRPPRQERARQQAGDPLGGQERRAGDLHLRGHLERMSNQFAERPAPLGVEKGDRVFVFLDRIPELYFAVFGTLKAGVRHRPAVLRVRARTRSKDRLADCGAKRARDEPRPLAQASTAIRARPAGPQARRPSSTTTASRRGERRRSSPGTTSWTPPRTSSRSSRPAPRTGRSCTTPPARPASRRAPRTSTRRSSGHYATGKYVLDLHDDDIYWCTADPGWVTGTSYGMFAPWTQRRDDP